MIHSTATVSRSRGSVENSSTIATRRMDFATLGRAPFRLGVGIGTRRITSRDLQIVEATEELLDTEVPDPEGVASDVSLLRGFQATIPSAEKSKVRRRQMRNVETPRLGLKKMGLHARGLLAEEEDHEGQSVPSEDDIVVVAKPDPGKAKRKAKKRGRESLGAGKIFGKEELTLQTKEIRRDKENVHVRRVRADSPSSLLFAD
jgi:division protein 1